MEKKKETESVFNKLVDQLKVTSAQSLHGGEFTSYQELKSSRKAYQRAYNSYEKMKEKFEETNEKYKKWPKLNTQKTIKNKLIKK